MVKIEKAKFKDLIIKIPNFMNLKMLYSSGLLKFKNIQRFLKLLFEKPKRRMFLFKILKEKKTVGFMDLEEKERDNFEIGILIFRKYQNRGLAKESGKELEKLIREMKIKKVLATIYNLNTPAIQLVKSFGFKEINKTKKETFFERKIKWQE